MPPQEGPYLIMPRDVWRDYRHDTPLTLDEHELEDLKGFNHALSLKEIEDIYLPLSRLLNFYVGQSQALHQATHAFLSEQADKVPFIIGVCGSVAVGKSTTSRILKTLLSRWPNHPTVALFSTDGFLYPNEVLEAQGLMTRKGFPESYDRARLIQTLQALKSGEPVEVPLYSHDIYNVTDETLSIQQPDIVIIEGLNILQQPDSQTAHKIHVSDLLDFSIFVDAPLEVIETWFLDRFIAFRQAAADKPDLFFHQYAQMQDDEAIQHALNVWKTINAPNLIHNILPFKYRASLILEKDVDHQVRKVMLRKV